MSQVVNKRGGILQGKNQPRGELVKGRKSRKSLRMCFMEPEHLLSSFYLYQSKACVYAQGSHASWEVLDYFLDNSRTWKVLENHLGPLKF